MEEQGEGGKEWGTVADKTQTMYETNNDMVKKK